MSRYIDAEWLENNAKEYSLGYYEADEWATPLNVLDSAPSIEIVHCVECRYKGMEICPMYKLTKAGVLKPYDFCSYGEREGE